MFPMATLTSFEDLECYRACRRYRINVAVFCKSLPPPEEFRLKSQLLRAARSVTANIAEGFGGLYTAAYKKFYIDEIYLFVTKKIIFNLIGRPAAWIDKNIVDGFMNLLATTTGKISELIKGFQSGKVQNYALYFFGGILGLAVLFIYLWN